MLKVESLYSSGINWFFGDFLTVDDRKKANFENHEKDYEKKILNARKLPKEKHFFARRVQTFRLPGRQLIDFSSSDDFWVSQR